MLLVGLALVRTHWQGQLQRVWEVAGMGVDDGVVVLENHVVFAILRVWGFEWT